MVAPDWFITLLQALGLKKSPKKELMEQITDYEEKKRQLSSELDALLSRISRQEASLATLKAHYEAAHGVEKEIQAAKIKPILQEFKLMSEKRIQIERKVNDLTLLIHNKQMLLQEEKVGNLTDEIIETTDNKNDLIMDMEDEKRLSKRLEEKQLTEESSVEPDVNASGNTAVNFDEIDQYFRNSSNENEKENEKEFDIA